MLCLTLESGIKAIYAFGTEHFMIQSSTGAPCDIEPPKFII